MNKRRYLTKYISILVLLSVVFTLLSSTGVFAKTNITPELCGSDGFAVLEITLSDGVKEESITKTEEIPMTYTLKYDDVVLENKTAQIRGRGNYTYAQAKKPYQITCDEKTDWFGFGKAKTWILLANITDQTNLRNYVAFTLASMMSFSFTPQVRHAHVFINGKYRGLYLITEKVQIGKNRVDIDISDYDSLIELDNNYGSGEKYKFKSKFGNLFVIKDPDDEDIEELYAETSPGVKATVQRHLINAKNKINNFEQAVVNRASLEEIAQYMDLSSLVDWYIFNEIMKNDDTLFNSSIYLVNDNDGVLYMGPVWDYDLALGGIDRYDNVDPTGFMYTENYWGRPNWFDYLLDRDDFMTLVKNRWSELTYNDVFNKTLSLFDEMSIKLETHYNYNYSVWKKTGVFVPKTTYSDAISYLRNFYVNRVSWLDTQWEGGVTPSPTPTSTPEPTPEVTPTPEATCTPDEANDNDKGCGSIVSSSSLVFLFSGVTILLSKRRKMW